MFCQCRQGLLYGGGDFTKSVDIAARCGQDADCNPATVGGVLLDWISWRAARYRLGSSTVELKSGVVFRQHRQVRYDRIQAVEITRPLMARLVGLSSVKVEAAGGLMSSIQLAYLPHAQALDIRADLLAQARSREVAGPRAGRSTGPHQTLPTAHERSLPKARQPMPAGRSFSSCRQ